MCTYTSVTLGMQCISYLFDSRMPIILLVVEVLYDTLIDFGVPMKLVRLIKLW
jgi:hypothetical protein